MATDAILRIMARVSGEGDVKRLSGTLGGVGPAAASSVPAVRRLGGAVADIAKVAAGMQLSRLISGLGGFSGKAINAGDEAIRLDRRIESLGEKFNETGAMMKMATEFGDKFTYSQIEAQETVAGLAGKLRQLGIELPQINEMLNSMGEASRNIGLSTQDTTEFFRQMAQAIGQGRLNGQELVTMLERVPPFAQALVNAYNNLAKDRGIIQVTKQRSEEIIKSVEKGEKLQIKLLENSAREREEIVQKETNAKLEKVRERYDREVSLLRDKNDKELQLLQDRFDDEDRLRRRAERDARSQIFERLSDQEQQALKEFNRRREDLEDWRDYQNDLNGISEEVQKQIKRKDDDWWDEQERELVRRFDAQRQAEEDRLEDEQVIRDRALRDKRKAEEKEITDALEGQEKALADRLAVQEEAIRKESDARLRGVRDQLDQEVEMVKEANKKIIADTRARTIATLGDVKKMAAEGMFTPDVVVRAASVEMKKLLGDMPPPTAMMKWEKTSSDFAMTVGKDLNPVLDKLVNLVMVLEEGFQGMNKELRTTLVIAGGIAGGIAAIKGAGAGLSWLRGGGRPPGGPAGPAAPPVNPYQIKPPASTAAANPFLKPAGPGTAAANPFLKPAGPTMPTFQAPPAPPTGPWVKFTEAIRGAGAATGQLFSRLAGIPQAIGAIGGAIAGTNVAATLAGWAAVLGPSGPIAGAISGLISWISGTAVPTLLGFFSGPAGWAVLAGVGITAAVVTWREPISDFLAWLGGQQEAIAETFTRPLAERMAAGVSDGLLAIRNEFDFESKVWDEFFVRLYDDFTKVTQAKIEEIQSKGLGKTIANDLEFESKVWDEFFLGLYEDFGKSIEEKAEGLARGIADGFSAAGDWIKNELNYIMQICENAINSFSSAVNGIINATNSVSGRLGINIPVRLQPINIPRLANGGWFNRSTLAEIGEGGDPGGEYAIPASRMPQAIQAWQGGARGSALVAAMQSPGLAPGRGGVGPAYSAPSSVPPAVNITIRPGMTMQTGDGRQWLSADDLPQIIAATMQAMGRH